MLRVGLTGGLGSGKSTAAALLQALGAYVLSSDEIGRALMQPGHAVFESILGAFGSTILLADGRLDRQSLAKIAFAEGRVEELNAIVHPAVIRRQAELVATIGSRDPGAVVIVESALIFETRYDETQHTAEAGWHRRFDVLILVTAPEELRVARFVARSAQGRSVSPDEQAALEVEARRRIAQQIPDDQKVSLCDYVITNGGPIMELEWQIDRLWPLLAEAASRRSGSEP